MVTFSVGEVEVTEIVETELAFPATQAFGGLGAESGEQALAVLRAGCAGRLFAADGQPLMVFRSHVIRTPSSVIVLDGGWGNGKERRLDPYAHMLDTGYLDALAAAGVHPDEVDYVFCSHLHQDHVGWNTRWVDGAWVPTFRNATYLFVRAELDFWSAVPAGDYGHDSFADSVVPVLRSRRHRWIEPGEHIDEAVRVIPLPGHTPGHCGLHIASGGVEVVFTGDLFHTALQFARPHWHIVTEHDPELGHATRRDFLERYAGSGVRIVTAHLNAPAGGQVVRRADHFGYAPL